MKIADLFLTNSQHEDVFRKNWFFFLKLYLLRKSAFFNIILRTATKFKLAVFGIDARKAFIRVANNTFCVLPNGLITSFALDALGVYVPFP